jgi:hypothetical protein
LDPWLDGQCIAKWAPDLVTTVVVHHHGHRTISAALSNNGWILDITVALTIPAFIQYVQLREHVKRVELDLEASDRMEMEPLMGLLSELSLYCLVPGPNVIVRGQGSLETKGTVRTKILHMVGAPG